MEDVELSLEARVAAIETAMGVLLIGLEANDRERILKALQFAEDTAYRSPKISGDQARAFGSLRRMLAAAHHSVE